MGDLPSVAYVSAEDTRPEGASTSSRSHKAKTPAELTELLLKCFRGSSMLLVALLDLEEQYVMTRAEAQGMADPTARLLMRIKALRKPIKYLSSNSDELALALAIGSYGIRIYGGYSAKQAQLQASRPANQQTVRQGVARGIPNTSQQTPDQRSATGGNTGPGSSSKSNGARPLPNVTPISGVAYSAFTEPLENGDSLFG